MAKLYFYFSAMNAGKTTTLLQSAYNYRERGEFHTLCHDGPLFAQPLSIVAGAQVLREQRFAYTDFLLDGGTEA